jgi:hypothetical protein
MKKPDLLFAIEQALIYDINDEGDTDQAVKMIFDGVIKILQRDTRFPRLTPANYDLLFADLLKDACETLAPYWKIDAKYVAAVIAEAVIDEITEETDDYERGKDPEATETTVVK